MCCSLCGYVAHSNPPANAAACKVSMFVLLARSRSADAAEIAAPRHNGTAHLARLPLTIH